MGCWLFTRDAPCWCRLFCLLSAEASVIRAHFPPCVCACVLSHCVSLLSGVSCPSLSRSTRGVSCLVDLLASLFLFFVVCLPFFKVLFVCDFDSVCFFCFCLIPQFLTHSLSHLHVAALMRLVAGDRTPQIHTHACTKSATLVHINS